MRPWGAFRAAAILAARQLRTEPDSWLVFVTSPLTVLTLLAITQTQERDDLIGIAIVAPALMALFQSALYDAAEQLSADRARGVLEIAVASPASLALTVLGRAVVIAVFSVLAAVQSLVIVMLYADGPVIHHPVTAAVVATAAVTATACLVLPLASLFLATRAVRVFQNALPWPIFLVSGVIVPVAMIPDWLGSVSRVFYLTYAARLLRECMRPGPVEHVFDGVIAILVSGAVSLGLGYAMFRWVLSRLRVSGGLALA